jgi:hypothetical protein
MQLLQSARHLGRRYLPAAPAGAVKVAAAHARYFFKARSARRAYRRYAGVYPQKVLFATGLPKSGTTWLVRLVASYPGFQDELVIPDIARRELAAGGSHALDLPDDFFRRFDDMLVFTKMHVGPSEHNVRLLREAGVPYVVMHRDLRDVAVSYVFYVRRTPWHPEFRLYRDLDAEPALLAFAERTLPDYVQWVRDWHRRIDPVHGIEVRYEEMLADPVATFTRVARHYGLGDDAETIRRIVAAQSFERASGGRARGEASGNSHFRKGIAGDWRNHFAAAVTERFRAVCGDFLVEFGYEKDQRW